MESMGSMINLWVELGKHVRPIYFILAKPEVGQKLRSYSRKWCTPIRLYNGRRLMITLNRKDGIEMMTKVVITNIIILMMMMIDDDDD